MLSAQEVQNVGGAARRGSGKAEAAVAANADGRAEFRNLFVSLVDPAGLLDTERCGELAGRMREAATRSNYDAGARMASALEGIFADTADIVDRPVEDGALHWTYLAFRDMIGALIETAEAYRDGKDPEPVTKLEEVRRNVARYRSEADEDRESLRNADPPGSGLSKFSELYRGKICRDVIRESQEKVRAYFKSRGYDVIFPPKPKPVSELFGEYDDPNISSADMIAEMRGRGPPDGYELVRIDG